MKLTFKDLKQQKFILDAEPTDTIASLKSKISAEKGWEPSSQKLIYSGKILQDDNTVESYKIEEKGFIVCMIAKPKPPPKAAAAPPATPAKVAEPATPAVPAAPAAAAAGTSDAAPATPSPAAPVAGGQRNFDDPSALAVGEERSAAIANMESMGFPRADIDRAMRAAFYNPDRAVEYLLNGIPASAQQEQRAAAAAPAAGGLSGGGEAPAAAVATGTAGGDADVATAAAGSDEPVNLFEAAARAGTGGARSTPASGAAATPAAGAGGDANQLDFLRNNPQFQQLRQVVQQQPQMLEPILQQVAAGNPQLAQIITQNPEQFMQLLAEDADEDVALPPGAQQISVTEEEREAIERLCRLGFERDLVIQAYFACDKNEELAANFLFDQPDEPEE